MPKIKKKTKSSNVLKFSFTETLTDLEHRIVWKWNEYHDVDTKRSFALRKTKIIKKYS